MIEGGSSSALSCDEDVSVCGIVTTCQVAELGVADTTFSQESLQTGVEPPEVVSMALLLITASPTATSVVSCGFSLLFWGWLGPGCESENASRLS